MHETHGHTAASSEHGEGGGRKGDDLSINVCLVAGVYYNYIKI